MSGRNNQMFALAGPPPETIALTGCRYQLVRVFKHDFFAATCLYESLDTGGGKVVVKFGRTTQFCGLPLAWAGRAMRRKEESIYRALAGLGGVPRWIGRVGVTGYAIEYIEGVPLDHVSAPPEGFFDRLVELMEEIHARGVAYCDANKRSNILIGPGGRAYLVDFQISLRQRDGLLWPWNVITRAVVRYMAVRDFYHIYKHKRRMCPERLTPQQRALSRRRSGLHLLHRKLTKPWRALRRKFLRRQYESGRLISPTAEMEDHDQPEKATWRPPKEPKT